MSDERLYIVTYDIADDKRWRALFKLMNGFGEWMQLSVFQCRLTRSQHLVLIQQLVSIICASEDHVMVIDVGPADSHKPQVQSLGKRSFDKIERAPVIV